jgi:hypothetical protein
MIVAVMAREAWTDERLDDLNRKVDEGFARLDGDIRELRGDVKDLRREMSERFESLNRTLIGAAAVLTAAVIGSNAL